MLKLIVTSLVERIDMNAADEPAYITSTDALTHVRRLQAALKKIHDALKLATANQITSLRWSDSDGWKYVTSRDASGWILIIVPRPTEVVDWLCKAFPTFMPGGFEDYRLIFRIQ
jgi:hypothetical protein